jgi:hypothetical protein
MKSLFPLILSSVLFSTTSFAALLTVEPSPQALEKVPVAKSAVAHVDAQNINLAAVGAGLRGKKVVFVNVKVYVGQLFVADFAKFHRDDKEVLNSLAEQSAAAIQMHFLRSVDADTVQKSFRDSFSANSVNLEDASIKQFLDAVKNGGAAEDKKNLTILGVKGADGTETIYYENSAEKVSQIKGSAGFIKNVFSIWLGKPSDDGVAQLKKSMLK